MKIFPGNQDVEAFQNGRITHAHLVTAREKLFFEVNNAVEGTLIFLFGPTGVGKTTLIESFREKFTDEMFSSGISSKGDLPVLVVEARAPDSPKFSWKELYRSTLNVMMEPLPIKKCPLELRTHKPPKWQKTVGYELLFSLQEAIIRRNVKVLIIDEAQHIGIGSGPGGIHAQLDHLKSIANLTETIIVLAGVYDLINFRNLSGQLSRRSIDIHFPRYMPNNLDECQEFTNVLATFQEKIPFTCAPPLVSMIEDLYAGSLGCVGILKSWLDRTVRLVAIEGGNMFTHDHLMRTVMSDEQLKTIWKELVEGEKKLTTSAQPLTKMKELLKIETSAAEKAKKQKPARNNSPGKKLKPGERKPQRLKNGRDQDVE
ncbi:ATP-binding protein [Geobacter pelophilus]|uniref:ATP-binding protein n=1 Tax=Geoanaerobacter pelophilus TaxID=60036 RepID=A0AAW4L298_9BACT|nr:ATP-binding protein [Geoanaerobacter pelophilus]MBT0663657.1 ATP-binding protein [Geoanaerobacter pelophilus]